MREFTYDGVTVRKRHSVPHWHVPYGLYFVTWRLADSVPRDEVIRLEEMRRRLRILESTGDPRSIQSLQREIFRSLERNLDRGSGACYMRQPSIAKLVDDALRFGDGDGYDLISHSIMPNHIHVVFRLLDELDRVLKRWKSYTAHRANKMLHRRGAFWDEDYFDVLIRNSRQLERTVTYVRMNPVKAELLNWPWVGFNASRFAELI